MEVSVKKDGRKAAVKIHRPTLSGSALKVLALASMTCDHAAKAFVQPWPWLRDVLFRAFGHDVSWFGLMTGFGRMAFPLFAFLAVEGFIHTRSRMRYMLAMLAAAAVSEPCFDFAFSGMAVCPDMQNVLFTLVAGLAAILAISFARGLSPEDRHHGIKAAGAMAAVALCLFGAWRLHFDYGARGVAFMLLLYMARGNTPERAVVGSCVLPDTWKAGLAFIPIAMYDGKRGFIKSPFLKYAFYAYYPVHLFVLRVVSDWPFL